MMVAPTVTIRPMGSTDLIEIADLEANTYSQPWSPAVWSDELAQRNRTYLAAEVQGAIVGYAGIMIAGDDAHVTTLVSDQARSVPRLGTRLMVELVERAIAGGAQHLTLEVRTSNERAQALYRRFGMAPVGVRKNYYRGEDALIMWAHDIAGAEFQERLRTIREDLT